jgi:hypothetical protein
MTTATEDLPTGPGGRTTAQAGLEQYAKASNLQTGSGVKSPFVIRMLPGTSAAVPARQSTIHVENVQENDARERMRPQLSSIELLPSNPNAWSRQVVEDKPLPSPQWHRTRAGLAKVFVAQAAAVLAAGTRPDHLIDHSAGDRGILSLRLIPRLCCAAAPAK